MSRRAIDGPPTGKGKRGARLLRRPGRVTASVLGLLSLALLAATLAAAALSDQISWSASGVANNASWVVFVLAFTAVGVLVARRESSNPMGWLLIGVQLALQAGTGGSTYATLDYTYHHGRLPLGHLAAALSPSWFVALALVPLVILLFPDGGLAPRWRWPLRAYFAATALGVAGIVSIAVASFSVRTPLDGSGTLGGLNHPSGGNAWFNAVEPVVGFSFVLLFGAAVIYQTRRYRRARGERRQQLKWLAAGAAACVACFVALEASGGSSTVIGGVFFAIGLAALPVGMGVGILKYRLYEIDRVISRTLSYALLSGLLIGTFIGVVALTTDTLALSGRVGVAASTLVAAALFNPLRVRIQRLVDHRFNRARYDAQATVEAFTARLGDAVEIDAIRADLLDAVNRAVQPTHASVWIKP